MYNPQAKSSKLKTQIQPTEVEGVKTEEKDWQVNCVKKHGFPTY